MTVATRKRVYTTLRCDICGRRLKPYHYIYSTWSGKHYCWPGEGCDK